MMGVDEGGSPITIKDPMAATVHSVVWKLYCANASSKRFVEVVFGHELAEKAEFVSALDRCITMIKTDDLATTLETMLDQVRNSLAGWSRLAFSFWDRRAGDMQSGWNADCV
jgi:hypothetical protein